jgi:D-alanine transaminase
MANQKAIKSNAWEVILHRNDFITEGSHTNFFAVKNKKIFTAPLSHYILDGVTRKVVLELCKKNNIEFTEEYIKINDLKNFDEFFITGTTTEITPIIKIDEWLVNDGKPGTLTRNIQGLFLKAIE